MYSALFLAPWMLIYACSGLVLNHNQMVRGWYGGNFGNFEKVAEKDYAATFSVDADARAVAAHILDDLGLSGTFNVQGSATSAKMVINRNAAFAQHRVTYFPSEHRLLIEKQAFTAPVFFNRAHFRHGYNQPFFAATLWAILLDVVVIGMVFWALSGVIMWWEIKPSRSLGIACVVASCGLFGVLLTAI